MIDAPLWGAVRARHAEKVNGFLASARAEREERDRATQVPNGEGCFSDPTVGDVPRSLRDNESLRCDRQGGSFQGRISLRHGSTTAPEFKISLAEACAALVVTTGSVPSPPARPPPMQAELAGLRARVQDLETAGAAQVRPRAPAFSRWRWLVVWSGVCSVVRRASKLRQCFPGC